MGTQFCKHCGTVIVMHWDDSWYHFLSGRVPCERDTIAEPKGVDDGQTEGVEEQAEDAALGGTPTVWGTHEWPVYDR